MKREKKIPVIYDGLDTTRAGTELCLVIDKHGGVFKFDSPSLVTIVKDAIYQMWPNFDKFDDWGQNNHAQVCTLHSQLFRTNAPKGSDPILMRVYVWKKLIEGAQDRTTGAGNPVSKTKTGRVSTIGSRVYELILPLPDHQIRTYQALACLKIITEESRPFKVGEHVDPISHSATDTLRYRITEDDLRKKVIERAAELKTKQDPWRIFQYYRPQLIAAKLIRHD